MLSIFKQKETTEQRQLNKLQELFGQAVERNDSKEMNRLYKEMKQLEEGNNDEDNEQKEIAELKNSVEKQNAIKKLEGFYKNVDEPYKDKAKEVRAQVAQAKRDYIDSLKVLNQLNNEFASAVAPYYNLMMKHDLDYKLREDKGEIDWRLTNDLKQRDVVPYPIAFKVTENDIIEHLSKKK